MSPARIRILVRGAVQGVGFRPFVYRLAREMRVQGWVANSADGLVTEAEGPRDLLEEFRHRVEEERPLRASVQGMESRFLDPVGFRGFSIRESDEGGAPTVSLLPDLATCPECVEELFDRFSRRYRYPFINCTNCGPRFTIIERLPYDRAHTTMRAFEMCDHCRREYDDPLDRRFHAQPNACARCGPRVELWVAERRVLAETDQAVRESARLVQCGRILALKGIGGFQFIVDAANPDAVSRLRSRKNREEKPFAIMAPSLEWVRRLCVTGPLEEQLLLSPEAPIVLLRRRPDPQAADARLIVDAVAPGNPCLGVMLPYSPLHHLLMRQIDRPVVATSGNVAGEPIAIDDLLAFATLNRIADNFLTHNRPIRRHADDSVCRVILGTEQVLRRARGYAPLPVVIRKEWRPALAVGSHLKNTVALAVPANTSGELNVFVSQHIGDLETSDAFGAFRNAIDDLQRLYGVRPETVLADMHPDYVSSLLFENTARRIQHHAAHVAACLADNGLEGPALGVAWDGAGYGPDGTVWGGEFLVAADGAFTRVAHLRTFPLPGGDSAARRPRLISTGVLFEILGAGAFRADDPPLARQMLTSGIRSPRTSSAGRLFDAVASLAGIRDESRFEGQAAMELEFAIDPAVADSYPFRFAEGRPAIADWEPMILGVLEDVRHGVARGVIAARFHNTLVDIILRVAMDVGEPVVALTGGCFQNRYLTERAVQRLTLAGFHPCWHRRIPPNDGGIALGQIAAKLMTENICASRFRAG